MTTKIPIKLSATCLLLIWIAGCTTPASTLTPTSIPAATIAQTIPLSETPTSPTAAPTSTQSTSRPEIPESLPTRYEGPLPDSAVAILGLGYLGDAKLSPDGQRLAVMTSNGLSMRRVDTLDEEWIGPNLGRDIDWLPDSGQMIITSASHVTLLDAGSGEIVRSLSISEVYPDASPYFHGWEDFQLAPDGSTLALSSTLGLTLWRIDSGKVDPLIRDNYDDPPIVGWSSDSGRLIQPKASQTVIWSAKDLQPVDTIDGQAVSWAPDFSLGLVKIDNTLWFWHGYGPPDRVGADCATAPVDWHIFALCTPERIIIDEIETGKAGRSIRIAKTLGDVQYVWSPDGTRLALGNARSIQVVNVDTGQVTALHGPIAVLPPESSYAWITWAPEGDTILTSVPGDAAVSVWDPASGERIQTLEGGVGPIQFVPGEPGMALINHIFDGLHLWNYREGKTLRQLTGSPSGKLGWSEDGTMVAVYDYPFTRYSVIWDAQTGEPLRQVEGRTIPGFDFNSAQHAMTSVSPDRSRTVVGTSTIGKATAVLKDSDTDEIIATIEKPQDVLFDAGLPVSFGWSPDSGVMVMDYGGSIFFIESRTGAEIGSLPGYARDFCFSPDGQFIATSGSVVTIWRVPY